MPKITFILPKTHRYIISFTYPPKKKKKEKRGWAGGAKKEKIIN
jgi:hypothetical protein